MKAIAAVARRPGQAFEVEELAVDAPRPGEALVRFVGTGLCHTDIALREMLPMAGPVVLGHEGAGVVEAVGSGVDSVAPGDRVVASFSSCGSCPSCHAGRPAYCRDFATLNLMAGRVDGSKSFTDVDGRRVGSHFFGQSSFASHALVPARNLVPLPDDVPLDIAGVLGCGVLTGAGAVLEALDAEAGSSILITGAGAVGLSAVMAAVVAGCHPIVAVDLLPSRLGLAEELGATYVVDGSATDANRALTDAAPGGFDYTIDTTGSPEVIKRSLSLIHTSGVCGLVGIPQPGAELTVDLTSLVLGRHIRGIIEGDAAPGDLIPRLLTLWRAGRFPFDRLITTYPLDEINQAVDDVHSGKATKAVVVFPDAESSMRSSS